MSRVRAGDGSTVVGRRQRRNHNRSGTRVKLAGAHLWGPPRHRSAAGSPWPRTSGTGSGVCKAPCKPCAPFDSGLPLPHVNERLDVDSEASEMDDLRHSGSTRCATGPRLSKIVQLGCVGAREEAPAHGSKAATPPPLFVGCSSESWPAHQRLRWGRRSSRRPGRWRRTPRPTSSTRPIGRARRRG
jgi:hypothetical protein